MEEKTTPKKTKSTKKAPKKFVVPYTSENKNFIPTYKSKSAAGFDVFANESFWLMPGRWRPVKTGWRFALPEGYAFLSCSRSGNAVKRGLISHIAPGVLDADYRGECFACVRNVSLLPRKINKGDRILQFVIVKIEQAEFELADTLSETERGSGGFGSTGK